MNLQELEQVKKDLADGIIVSRQTWMRVLDAAIAISNPTPTMCKAGIFAYEELMGGERLPDGDGYDFNVVGGIYRAMLEARIK
jgi:hypothetical protein